MKKPSKKTITLVVTFIIAFILGMEYKAAQIRSALTENLNQLQTSFESEDTLFDFDKNPDEKIIIEGSVGEEVVLSTMNAKVNSFEEANTVTSGFGSPTPAGSGAKFVVVDLDLNNTGKEPFTFFDSDFSLLDQKGNSYDSFDSISVIDNYINVRDLAPSIPENGKILFKVPEDSTNFKLLIDNEGEDEVYHVKLN